MVNGLKAWVDYYELKPGDIVEIVANDHLTIRIDEAVPEKDDGDSN